MLLSAAVKLLCFRADPKQKTLTCFPLLQCVRMAGAAASSTETGGRQPITSVMESSTSLRSES